MIKNAIFNIGNTLLEYSIRGYSAKNFEAAATRELLYTTIFKREEGLALARGTTTGQTTLQSFYKKQPKFKKEIAQGMKTREQSRGPKEEALRLLKALKTYNYKTYLLFNSSKKSFAYVKRNHLFPKKVDDYLISLQVKLVKLEKAIFETFLKRFKLKPAEGLFIGDFVLNLATASALGLKSVSFENSEKNLGNFKKKR